MPKFQKDLPDNAISYIDPASDEEFQKKHPVKYGILVFCGIAGLVLPLVILLIITEVFFPAPSSGFLIMAMAGCFIIGIGIFNVAAAWIGQYLGHAVTIGCFSVGGILVAISCIIIYVPDIYALFNENIVSFYFGSMLFFALPPIYYAMFRFSVNSWLRRKRISKTMITWDAFHLYIIEEWVNIIFLALSAFSQIIRKRRVLPSLNRILITSCSV